MRLFGACDGGLIESWRVLRFSAYGLRSLGLRPFTSIPHGIQFKRKGVGVQLGM